MMEEVKAQMTALINHLVEQAPEENKRAVECQIVLRSGLQCAGALKWHDTVKGMLHMTSVGTTGGDRRGAPVICELFFLPADILQIQTLREQAADLVLPPGAKMPNIPGLQRR